MAELLEALGWRMSFGHCVRMIALVGTTTTAILVAALAFADLASVSILVVQAAIWFVWLAWLGIVFPRNGRRDSETPCALPYRRAFMREILLGISVAFSQFLRPIATGLIDGMPSSPAGELAIGAPMILAGGAMVAVGVSALGVARTLFVHEYVPRERRVVRAGIYRFVRHPLFLGGALVSLGLAVCTGDRTALELGFLNACVCPLYVQLEDRRCFGVLGREYVDYSVAVGGVVPRRRAAIRPSAQLHHAAGRIEPITGRAEVTRR
jgi:protein-S-isoprenylcysteine O-methyltransferase Ste14